MLLVNGKVAENAVEVVEEHDFYRVAHRRIFAAVARCVERETEVDLVTIRADLAQRGELDDVGGPAYISSLVDGVPRSSNWPYYAEIIKELRRRRDIVFYANKVSDAAYSGVDVSGVVIEQADEGLFELRSGTKDAGIVTQEAAAKVFFEALETRVAKREELLGHSTGLPAVDEFTCGLVGDELTVLAAETAAGKTALALNMAVAVAERGHAVIHASLEMARTELEYRIAAFKSGVKLFKIRKGWMSDHELSRVCVAMSALTNLPLFIDDRMDLTVRDLRARCRAVIAEHPGTPLGLVIVDYVQLMSSEAANFKDTRRSAELAIITRGLKRLAREFHVPVIALSQLSRDSERKKIRPVLARLKESSTIEQDADTVWFLYCTEENREDMPMELIVAKQRNGPTGTVDLVFDREIVRFRDPKTQGPYLEPFQAAFPVVA
jgi:replicative DNA helicase